MPYFRIAISLVVSFLMNSQQVVSQEKPAKSACPSYFHKDFGKNIYQGDSLPDFSGGVVGYMRFINKNLRVSEEVAENQESPPIVMMEFIVDEKGKLNCIVLNGKKDSASFEPMEKEVMRVLRLMPDWIPGNCNGKKVPMEIKRPFLVCIKIEQE